jgi:hypothetical protein
VVYDYEEITANASGQLAGTPAWNPQSLAGLSRKLVEELRDATVSGNKKLLDKLILEVRETSGDADSALALRDLADRYDYDTLTRVLEEACAR